MMKTICLTGLLLMCASLAGCKGRTMENMEPTGDTVEVVVDNRHDSVKANSVPSKAIETLEKEDEVAAAEAI